ncbi:response regulator transcription factor [Nonomuraea jiangxiensis]|uniref:DNA-binding response regulator, NarL/FixJ family, contains REC and HTH domains n=1 Tax=Nonomuraea jiangxiensis TaxID=633440 RepID=A0A1G8D510_9ACTN|nr:response regulator transcription factor [Nonomuraea jiangxiensis]SDH52857.1 DNA-binding response regulator, NarL/FixJ family, contains REC and HTH domains [Nonomuraea jiangxiensis]
MTARVVVVDDQTVVREGLTLLLGLLPGVEVVGSAADGEAALELVAAERPDVVLMDLRMPRMDGVEATRRIRAAHPDTQVVVLTTYSDDESVFSALQAGARGFLTKSADAEEIDRAVATVMRGDAQLDTAVQRRLLETMLPPPPKPADGKAPAGPTGGKPLSGPADGKAPAGAADRESLPDGLTRREAEVLRLIARGRSNAEISGDLFIGEATVKTHINNLFAKIGARDRAQAVTYAYRHGLADP